jgi:hypothetical protein
VALGRRARARVFRDGGQVKRGARTMISLEAAATHSRAMLLFVHTYVRVKDAAELEQRARGLTVSLGERRSEIATIGCLCL